MRRLLEFITRHWLAISVGVVATAMAVAYCYTARGKFCVGGEWLILPAELLVARLVSALRDDVFGTLARGGGGHAS